MGRRLAEATKARRTRRTRGDGALCFFLFLAAEALRLDATVFFVFVAAFVAGFAAVFGVAALAGAFALDAFEGACFAGACFVGLCFFVASEFFDDVDACDCATADGKKPSEKLKRIPANTTTAKRRTQILPTVESWNP
jgi:hypothetical protein